MIAVMCGMAIGVGVGVALENLAIGVALGTGFALAFRGVEQRFGKRDDPDQPG